MFELVYSHSFVGNNLGTCVCMHVCVCVCVHAGLYVCIILFTYVRVRVDMYVLCVSVYICAWHPVLTCYESVLLKLLLT